MLLPYFCQTKFISERGKKIGMKRRTKTTKEKQNNKFNVNIEINRTGAKLDTYNSVENRLTNLFWENKKKIKREERIAAMLARFIPKNNISGKFYAQEFASFASQSTFKFRWNLLKFSVALFEPNIFIQFILYVNWLCDLQCHLESSSAWLFLW